jgi:hypothetical protein
MNAGERSDPLDGMGQKYEQLPREPPPKRVHEGRRIARVDYIFQQQLQAIASTHVT